jgi:Mn-dependent DtxR family transcriptional regulator
MGYFSNLHQSIIELHEDGVSLDEIAIRLKVDLGTVAEIIKDYEEDNYDEIEELEETDTFNGCILDKIIEDDTYDPDNNDIEALKSTTSEAIELDALVNEPEISLAI